MKNFKYLKTEIIDKFIKDNKLSKEKFCKKCEIGSEDYDDMFRQSYNLDLHIIAKVCKYMNIKFYEIFSSEIIPDEIDFKLDD